MAYFSNGTEGQMYEENVCHNCVHYPKGEIGPYCSIWNIHLEWAGGLCNAPDTDIAKQMLERLIPTTKRNLPGKCSMFTREGDKDKDMVKKIIEQHNRIIELESAAENRHRLCGEGPVGSGQ